MGQTGRMGNRAVSEWQRMAFSFRLEDREVKAVGACSERSTLHGSQLPIAGWDP